MKTLSIVAPFFNEKDNVRLFHDAVAAVADGLDRWTVPTTRLLIERQGSGVRAGEFLFSATSIDRGSSDSRMRCPRWNSYLKMTST